MCPLKQQDDSHRFFTASEGDDYRLAACRGKENRVLFAVVSFRTSV
jgi:hypothetical protein